MACGGDVPAASGRRCGEEAGEAALRAVTSGVQAERQSPAAASRRARRRHRRAAPTKNASAPVLPLRGAAIVQPPSSAREATGSCSSRSGPYPSQRAPPQSGSGTPQRQSQPSPPPYQASGQYHSKGLPRGSGAQSARQSCRSVSSQKPSPHSVSAQSEGQRSDDSELEQTPSLQAASTPHKRRLG